MDAEPRATTAPRVPRESLGRLFLRFLKFGLLAWGGPVAQIGMLRDELVVREGWVSRERFNRVLAVYQALPGPEATELSCYFGMLSRGRAGALVAGLGFVLPGFLMMFALSWLYVEQGVDTPPLAAAFAGMQAAVCALIVRAVHRIGAHALHDHALWAIALLAGASQAVGVHFAVPIVLGGVAYAALRLRRWAWLGLATAAFAGAVVWGAMRFVERAETMSAGSPAGEPALWEVLVSGLRGGMLTFGGAYTVIPFLRRDAVEVGGWMTDAQFLDSLALSGILPAPLIIFGTMVGFIARGPLGALLMTFGLFLPAFSFTLIGHNFFEKVIDDARLHAFLDGVTAAVVGLIAMTAVLLIIDTVTTPLAAVVFAAALATLYLWKSRMAIPSVVIGAALLGLALMRGGPGGV